MPPAQKQKLELKIKRIKATLAAEKLKFGGYDDSRGLRVSSNLQCTKNGK